MFNSNVYVLRSPICLEVDTCTYMIKKTDITWDEMQPCWTYWLKFVILINKRSILNGNIKTISFLQSTSGYAQKKNTRPINTVQNKVLRITLSVLSFHDYESFIQKQRSDNAKLRWILINLLAYSLNYQTKGSSSSFF